MHILCAKYGNVAPPNTGPRGTEPCGYSAYKQILSGSKSPSETIENEKNSLQVLNVNDRATLSEYNFVGNNNDPKINISITI